MCNFVGKTEGGLKTHKIRRHEGYQTNGGNTALHLHEHLCDLNLFCLRMLIVC
jgi:hypothetical protein